MASLQVKLQDKIVAQYLREKGDVAELAALEVQAVLFGLWCYPFQGSRLSIAKRDSQQPTVHRRREV